MKRLSEGIVGNIGKRSLGKLQRKEDIVDVNKFNYHELLDYIKQNYNFKGYENYRFDCGYCIHIPIVYYNFTLSYLILNKNYILLVGTNPLQSLCFENKKNIKNELIKIKDIEIYEDISAQGSFTFTNKNTKEKISNNEIIQVLDFLTYTVPNCIAEKKIN